MIYSPFKAVRHEDRINKMRRGEMVFPTHAQIDITNACNHRCPYCFYRVARNETLNALFHEDDFIPRETMIRFLDELSELNIPAVQYTGGGEPLFHPDFREILTHTIRKGFEYALVTNGGLVDASWIPLFRHAAWIRFSLDAASEEIHARSQGTSGKEFEKTIKTIEHIVRDCPDVIMGISFVINPINYREIFKAAEQAKALGAHNIRLSIAYTPKGPSLLSRQWGEIESQAARAKELEDDNFKVFNLVLSHLETLQYKKKGYKTCGYQYFTVAIGADGVVYPCCTLKYNPVSAFGNINKESFLDIWQGEKRTEWLEANYLKNVCDKNPCWMDRKNQFISYLVSNRVQHENFV